MCGFLFTGPVPATTARRIGIGLLREAMALRGETDLASYDRLFPSRDYLPGSTLRRISALRYLCGPAGQVVPLRAPPPDRPSTQLRAHAMHVITTTEPAQVPASGATDARLIWTGPDDRGIELEIVALDLDEAVVVIHVMPTSLRR
jgi:hypothetical protein